MPVHCYGTPCDVERIEAIARKHELKVIYDAAHAFGVRQDGQSILRHGDLSVLSFHATKVFNTFEGGAIVCRDAAMKQHIDHLKNFGIADEVTVVAAGINGKMHEVSAAFGLLQLEGIDAAIASARKSPRSTGACWTACRASAACPNSDMKRISATSRSWWRRLPADATACTRSCATPASMRAAISTLDQRLPDVPGDAVGRPGNLPRPPQRPARCCACRSIRRWNRMTSNASSA
jgi:hypothetical protein